MAQSQFSLTWEGYKNSMCGGFSSLQQNGEFVDMTLAADGHLVKVHQMLLALASPYFKELIASAPCPHPVIFLNSVTHRTLCSLLEYIYTGEVVVAAEFLQEFFVTAKALHVRGLDDMSSCGVTVEASTTLFEQVEESSHRVETMNIGTMKKIETVAGDTIEVPLAARNIKREISLNADPPASTPPKKEKVKQTVQDSFQDVFEDVSLQDPGPQHDSDNDDEPLSVEASKVTLHNMKSNLQFTVSNRGALQAILNRYLYNLNSRPNKSGVRRWRCVEYRNNRCLAFVTTKGNVVLNRANLHNHPFHDKRILQKIENKSVYSAFDEVKRIKKTSKDAVSDNEDDVQQVSQEVKD